MGRHRWVWVGLLLGCTPKAPAEPWPTTTGRTVILAYSLAARGWVGEVLGAGVTSARAPTEAVEVAVLEYWASPDALGVRPGDRLGAGPREAPIPDGQWSLAGARWIPVEPRVPELRLPECPALPGLPSGYCGRRCAEDEHDRGDGVCWPRGRCLPGWRADTSGCGRCGDGRLSGDETCDDENTAPGDGCGADCAEEEGWRCGAEGCKALECSDGHRAGDEQCDDGNTAPGDGCDVACAEEEGWRCGAEGCEARACGDGRRAGAEECDDGNTAPGDGCGADCREEDGWTCPVDGPCAARCGDGHRVGAEECDPPGPGCRACGVEPGWWCPGACEPDTVVAGSGDLGRRYEALKGHPVRLENRGGALTLTSVVLDPAGSTFSVSKLSSCEEAVDLARGGGCTLAVDYDPLNVDDRAEVRVDYVRDGAVGRLRIPLRGRSWCQTLPPNLASTIGVAATTTTATLATAGRYASGPWTLGWIDGRLASGRWQTLHAGGPLAALASVSPSVTCAAGERGDHAYAACLSSGGEVSRLDADLPGRATALAIGSGGAPFVAGWTGPGFPNAPKEGSAFVLALGASDLEVARRAVMPGPTLGPEGQLALAVEPGDAALHLVGTSSGGDVSWTRLSPTLSVLAGTTFGTAAPDAGTHAVAHRCGVFVAGWSEGDLGGDKPRGRDVVVARLDPATGARRWFARVGGEGDDRPVGLAVDRDGLVLVAIAGPRNAVWGLDPGDGHIVRLTASREELEVPGAPSGLTVDADGRVFVSGQGTNATELSVCRNDAGVFIAHFPRPSRSLSCAP